VGLITTLTATVKGRASCLAAAATSPASYAAVPAARSSRRASGSALQPLDPAMLGRELMIVVVDVATRRLRRSVPHDPPQPRKLRLRRRHVEPPEGAPERVRVRLLDRHVDPEHDRSDDPHHSGGRQLSVRVWE